MAFVIDSTEWDFTGLNVLDVSCKLEKILDRLSDATNRAELVYWGSSLQSQIVAENMDLWTFLHSDSMNLLNKDLLNELSAFLNTATFYEDHDACWPKGFAEIDVFHANGHKATLDVAFAHLKLMDNEPFAFLSFGATSNTVTRSERGNISILYIHNDTEQKSFWRSTALSMLRDTPENLEYLSSHAYPNLYFVENVWKGIKLFDGGYPAVHEELKKYLAVFDDYGKWIFEESPPALQPSDVTEKIVGQAPTNELLVNRFRAFKLDVSPEKPEVRKDNHCRIAREVTLNGKTLYCEWHGKLELHKNRIHIHKPVPQSDDKLVIAVFCEHLPLPR